MNALSIDHATKELPMPWVDRLFLRFHGRFGNQFLDKYRTGDLIGEGENKQDAGIVNAKATWTKELGELSPEEIKHGVGQKFNYPPSCDEFKAACQPKTNPELQLQVAIVQWGNRHNRRTENWPDCRTFWTAYRMQYELLNTEAKYLKGQWLAKWAESEADAGKPIPVVSPVEAIEHKKATMTKDEAKRHASSISLSIGMSATSWAGTYCPNDNRMTIAKRIKALQQLRIAIPAKIHAQAVKMGLGQELGLETA